VRFRTVPLFLAAVLLALLAPAASADVCIGSSCNGGGGGTSGGTPLNRLVVSDGFDHAASTQVTEGDKCLFHIRRLAPYGGTTTVAFHTVDGSATSIDNGEDGRDYVARSGVATFNASNPTNVSVKVQTLEDAKDEADPETFFLRLGRTSNGDKVDATGECDIAQGGQPQP
jgi:hypothetical protein